MAHKTGLFITFEGIEGCGKTTQIQKIATALRQQHQNVVMTREPGGCDIANQIRSILLDSANAKITAETELLLYAAARAQHVADIIKPALQQGKIVLCDRFTDATIAYQGYGRKLDLATIEQLNNYACQGVHPDLTLLLDLPVETGLNRARSRNAHNITQKNSIDEDRFEQENFSFHQRVRDAYLQLSGEQADRIQVIDATGDVDVVFKRLINAVMVLNNPSQG